MGLHGRFRSPCLGCGWKPAPASYVPAPGVPVQPPVTLPHGGPAPPRLPFGARGGGPGAALAAAIPRWLSRFLLGLLCSRHRLPPELFRTGPAPSPAPGRRLRYSHEIQSPGAAAGCWLSRPTFAPAAGGSAWGHGHLAKQFTGTHPSGLTPLQLLGNSNRGLNACPAPHASDRPPTAQAPARGASSGMPARHCGMARWEGCTGHGSSHGYRDQLLRARDRCDNRAEYLLLFLFEIFNRVFYGALHKAASRAAGMWDAQFRMRDAVAPRPTGGSGGMPMPSSGAGRGSRAGQRHGAGRPFPAGSPAAGAA